MLWDTYTAQTLARLENHRNEIAFVRFSSDGSLLLTSDRGGLSLAWDLVPAFDQAAIDRSKCSIQ